MRLAIFMDGTWDDANDDTNVRQLHDRVQRPPGGDQLTCYVRGVGCGRWDRLRGGVLGYGVDANIREGYRFLAEHHRPGDQVYLVGFSRGAFTARSLAGMVAKCGIVDPDVLGDGELFARYRDPHRPGLREMRDEEDDPAARTAQDREVLAHARLERIRFIGVFDTVGALGIPGDLGRAFARRYQFHDVGLSGLVDVARHAVAIDEDRPEFVPTLWSGVPIPVPGHPTSIEQRWFVGAHSDVGGGGDRAHQAAPLCALAREWIAQEARGAGLDVAPPDRPLTGSEWASPFPDSFRTFLGPLARLVPGREPLLRPLRTAEAETLSPSVVQRWTRDPGYRPRNPSLAPWVKSLVQEAERARGEAGAVPRPAAPAGTAPSGTAPSGTAPAGTAPSGTAPSGTAPSGTAPSGTTPSGMTP